MMITKLGAKSAVKDFAKGVLSGGLSFFNRVLFGLTVGIGFGYGFALGFVIFYARMVG